MKTKSFLALLMMGALLLTSCNKDKGVSDKVNTKPQDVVVSLDLGDNLRAAMADPQDLVKAGKASIANVDVYLTTTDGSILTAKRFATGSDDFNKLTSAEEIGQKGGYKFIGIDATVTRASVVVNPQGAALTIGDNVNELQASILSKASEAVYAELNKPVEAMGVEPIDPDPAQDKANVKKVQFTLKGDMSRFQVATVFSTIEFKDEAAKEAFQAWRKQYIKDNPGADRKYDATDAEYVKAQHAKFGSYNDGQPTPEWLNTWKVVKVTDENKGALMNNFDNILKLSSKEVTERLNFTTFADSYNRADGTLTISGKDVTAVASYFNNNGFTTTFEGTDAKVLAFNFFAKQALGKNLKDKGVAPSLHFYFKGTHVDEDHQFVNFVGYDLDAAFKESQLLNIDMSKINNGNGIIVQSDDPTVPGKGKPDVTNDKFNLIVRVTVADWTEVNVTPIAE
ncbi:MAG: hypothetical protein SOW36_03860 [Porphyromonas sp.]|uniref:hypothetical protein n=1 Tax=Porphyromonas sp. TaxID=1924944 RepID=UPI002A75244B|nr:hypothetical protein [Porphyromonas sp.]MDD6927846.1 hypothetical protein [Bacteroidales bacterium]MDY3111765.1 hypothetical protein [Porphyromonas sp.]MDY4245962.1 hypothetical protein [Porphyromonas sp.]